MTFEEMAWEFVDVFDSLDHEQINEMLVKNVPYETIEFVARYAADFADNHGVQGSARNALPNLILIGYLLRVLEQRLKPTPS